MRQVFLLAHFIDDEVEDRLTLAQGCRAGEGWCQDLNPHICSNPVILQGVEGESLVVSRILP